MRAQAQLQLQQMHCYTRSTQVNNRCQMGGIARGVLRAFHMGRVRSTQLYIWARTDGECLQYQFRMNALAGNLPGVKKASW